MIPVLGFWGGCGFLGRSGPVWASLSWSGPVWAGLGWSGPVLGFWCGCRFLGRSGLVWAGQGRSGLVWAGPPGRPAGFGEKTLSRRPAGFGQKTKEEEESKCRNVKSVPRPAGRPAGFGEHSGNFVECKKQKKLTKPGLSCHWLLKLFCIRKSFMRDLIV